MRRLGRVTSVLVAVIAVSAIAMQSAAAKHAPGRATSTTPTTLAPTTTTKPASSTTTTTVAPASPTSPTTPTTTTSSFTTTTVAPTTTTPPTTTAPPLAPAPTATGLHVEGWHIKTATGAEFVPVGANVGLPGAFDWHGVANGHAAEAKQWGWNTVRLNVCFTCPWLSADMATARQVMVDRIIAVVDEYTAAGIVVIVASHDTNTVVPAEQTQVHIALHDLATRYRTNSLVWFNGMNEPEVSGQAWNDLCRGYYDTVRATGNPNIVVCDAPADANDGNWDPQPHLDNAAGAATLEVGRTNIVFSTHNYGGHGSLGQEDLAPYVARVRALNVAVIVGEFGYRVGQTDGAFTSALQNFDAFRRLGLGVLAWHGTHGDGFTLRQDPCPFYAMSCALTDFGARMWGLTH